MHVCSPSWRMTCSHHGCLTITCVSQQDTVLEQRRLLVSLRALLHSSVGSSMSVVIEDITDRFPYARVAHDDAHEPSVRQEDDEEFHDAADSEGSYEDATEQFDVDALHAAQQRAQPAGDAGGYSCHCCCLISTA
jgi:hypothetical protein